MKQFFPTQVEFWTISDFVKINQLLEYKNSARAARETSLKCTESFKNSPVATCVNLQLGTNILVFGIGSYGRVSIHAHFPYTLKRDLGRLIFIGKRANL